MVKKIIISFCLCLVFSKIVSAQTDSSELSSFFTTMPNVEVYQDTAINNLISNLIISNPYLGSSTEKGFRVQVYSSNQQQGAKEEAQALRDELLSTLRLSVYLTYNSPMWKVRVGDFTTRSEAEEWRDVIKKQFPKLQGNIYVVPDDINR